MEAELSEPERWGVKAWETGILTEANKGNEGWSLVELRRTAEKHDSGASQGNEAQHPHWPWQLSERVESDACICDRCNHCRDETDRYEEDVQAHGSGAARPPAPYRRKIGHEEEEPGEEPALDQVFRWRFIHGIPVSGEGVGILWPNSRSSIVDLRRLDVFDPAFMEALYRIGALLV